MVILPLPYGQDRIALAMIEDAERKGILTLLGLMYAAPSRLMCIISGEGDYHTLANAPLPPPPFSLPIGRTADGPANDFLAF
jgi:hypothetical protein